MIMEFGAKLALISAFATHWMEEFQNWGKTLFFFSLERLVGVFRRVKQQNWPGSVAGGGFLCCGAADDFP